VLNCVPEKKTY